MKHTSETELAAKHFELLVASEALKCEKCSAIIAKGEPYILRSNVQIRGNDFLVVKTRECIRLCPGPAEKLSSEALRGEPLIWDRLPQVADERQRKNFPIELIHGSIKIALGYEHIVSWSSISDKDGREQRHVFVGCSDEQVVKTQFYEVPNDSHFGKATYKSYRAPNGFRCRRYSDKEGDFWAGLWYFAARFVRPIAIGEFRSANF